MIKESFAMQFDPWMQVIPYHLDSNALPAAATDGKA